ncbi:prolipoprotein diacylglyceryl transferase family protein [Roseburia sp. 831b]|uniref:prolipoprotein diacylglyceryl transferase family protein n=1 Tax=Roseburia sp. 831b TaxID=1261635 RepID=UPI0009534A2B|nr:prolipoprotein diacylglyceryl transferase family protein [Roseburia sp. 831b]WVK72791.1 prolipoprotein diacylglyceryl transferase [Roseburia sp. 831b]
MEIVVWHWRISPYAICFFLSFVAGFSYVARELLKRGIEKRYIAYSMMLNIALILYGGWAFTLVVQYLQNGKVEKVGFSSLGGAVGMLLGVWIFTKIDARQKDAFVQTYTISLGLMYGVSKLGCFFAGCCRGKSYDGLGCVRYLDGGNKSEWMIPVQLIETIIFVVLFLFLNRLAKKGMQNISAWCVVIYAFFKFLLDFLRDNPPGQLFSINQWVCLLLFMIAGGKISYDKRKNDSKNGRV